MSTYNYYLHGWNENDANVLASILYVVGDKLPLLGERTFNPSDASIWLSDIDSVAGYEFWQNTMDNRTSEGITRDAGHFKIALSHTPLDAPCLFIRKPLRVNGEHGVLTVFKALLGGNDASTASNDIATTKARHSLDSLFQHLAAQENIKLIFPDQARIWIDAKNEQCWSNRHPRQWIRFFPQLLMIQPASDTAFESLAMRSTLDCHAYPLDSIKWCAGLFLWKGEASPQAAQQQTYQLKNWPNFTNLPHHPKHLSLTNHLVRYPRKIDELMEDTELSRDFIQNFINACMSIDLLHVNPSRVLNSTRDKRTGFNPLGALLSRLGVAP